MSTASEDEIVDSDFFIMFIRGSAPNVPCRRRAPVEFHTKTVEGFLRSAELVATVFASVGIAPVGAEAECQPWMKAAEKHLAYAAVEDTQHQAIAELGAPQAVAVAEKEFFSADAYRLRLDHFLYSETLEERVAPDVVVTRHEIHLDSLGNHLDQFAEHPCALARNNIAVFIPEIPDITQQPYGLCFRITDAAQPLHETLFAPGRVVRLQPEVDIRNEICLRPVHLRKYENQYAHDGAVEREPAQAGLAYESYHHLAGE